EGKLARRAITPENAIRLQRVLVRSVQVLVEVGPELVNVLVPGTKVVALAGRAIADKAGWTDKLDELAGDEGSASRAAAAFTDQPRIFEQVTRVLTTLAEEQPLLLILDDLQWVDTASAGLLFHLGRSISRSRILLVGIYRPADVALGRGGERHPLSRVLGEFKRYLGDVWIDLDRAVAVEGRRFVDGLLDLEPNDLDEHFRQALFERTEGHPLFTVELLRHMRERNDLVLDARGRWVAAPGLDWAGLPARVEGVIRERLGRLPEALRDLLTVASVEGEEFTAEVLAQVEAQDVRDVVGRLSEELERQHRLVHAQDLRHVGRQRLSIYRFWHSLFQAYLYADLTEAERVYLHQDVGTVLETLYGELAGQIALQLARHFEAAGLAEKAVAYRYQAGEQALALYAPYEAVRHLSRALEVARSAALDPPPGVYRARGEAYEVLGDFEQARADFETALDAARGAGDPALEWRVLIDLGELWAARDYQRTGEYYRQALERARALDDPTASARALNRVGNWHVNAGQPHQALQYHQEALAIFQKLADQHGMAETHDLLGMAYGLGGDMLQSAVHYSEAVDLFQTLDDRFGLVSSLSSTLGGWDYLTLTLASTDPGPSACTRDVEQALALARQIGHRGAEAYALFSTAFCLGPQGEYTLALERAQAGLALAEEIGHHQWRAAAHCALGAIYLDLLAWPLARRHLGQALDLAREVGSLFWTYSVSGLLALTCIEQGALDEAQGVLDTVLNPALPMETIGQRLVWLARATLAQAAGDPELALEIAGRLIDSAANLEPGQAIPRLWRLRAEALAALQHLPEAEEDLQAALQAATGADIRPQVWRIHRSLDRLYQASGQAEAAARELRAAQDLVAELARPLPEGTLRAEFMERAMAP
ncbi:MAG: tetratricopeptide repeat protein, partial [Anaerolineae bacterium]|nr:tetratricopeptide repeat protein [Anaerolineae bacterium]